MHKKRIRVLNTKMLTSSGADLASPSDDLMLNAMLYISKDAVDVNCGVYTGIHSWFSKGDFTSIDGRYIFFALHFR